MFFAGSCQQENLEPAAKGNTVTYTVEAPVDVQTKAIGDGLNVNKVIYEVWHTSADGTTKLVGEGKDPKAVKLYQNSEDMVLIGEPGNQVNRAVITLDLLADQHYTILFWAQVDGTGVYNTKELTAVTYNNLTAEAYAANDERLAAFYAVDFINDGIARNSKVTLTRPFAQVNLGTLNSKAEAKENDYKIDLKQSRMILDAVPTVFNTATDEVSGYQTMTFAFHDVPAVKAEDATLTVNDTPYQYAGMNYVFAGANISLTYDIKVSLNGSEEYATVNNTVPQVPVKRNYRTNIVGNLLTSKTEYEVVVDARFNEPAEDIVLVDTPAELQTAINAASATEEITLDGDVNLSELFEQLTKSTTEGVTFFTVPAGKEITLNLNGYSITGVDQTQKNFGLIQNNGKLTVKNTSTTVSKMSLVAEHNNGWNRYSAVISNNPGAELTVEGNVVIEHLGGTDMSYGIDALTNGTSGAVKTTIDGATVTSTYRAVRQFLNSDSTMNELLIKDGSTLSAPNKGVFFHDPSTKANLGKLTIEDGASVGTVYLYVTAGSTEWPVEVSIAASSVSENGLITGNVPADLMVANVDGFWTVVEAWVEEGDEVVIKSAEALALLASKVNSGENYFEGKTIKLGADIDLKDVEWTPIGSAYIDHGFMGNFDGNGYTIKNLSMTNLAKDSDGYVYAGLFGVTEGVDKDNQNYIKNLTIENVTIETDGHIVAAAVAYPYYTALENVTVKGDINIKGGDYTAGVLAYTRRCVDAKNIAIVANANSVIEGNKTVGGVISDIQMNGGLTANYSNFSASGVTVKGVMHVGGISGIICLQTLNGAIVENVAIVSDDVRKGALVGSLGDDSVINGASVNNVTGAANWVGATYKYGSTCSVTINGVAYKYLENGKIEDANGYEIVANGLGYKDKTYAVSTAEGLVALATQGLKAGDKVILTADIDLTGVEFNGLDTFHPENNNVFDGQGHKVSNWTNNSGASDMGFIRNWVGTIKNLTIEKAALKTNGRSAIVGAKVYGNIENCHVVDCTLEDSYWACGLIAGLYNAGNISNCSATNSTVKSNGGTGAIVGVVNETAGTRSFTNCVVTGCTVNNTGAYGEAYCGALVCGMINISNSTVNIVGCELSNNTKAGKYVGDFYYAAGESVTVVVE